METSPRTPTDSREVRGFSRDPAKPCRGPRPRTLVARGSARYSSRRCSPSKARDRTSTGARRPGRLHQQQRQAGDGVGGRSAGGGAHRLRGQLAGGDGQRRHLEDGDRHVGAPASRLASPRAVTPHCSAVEEFLYILHARRARVSPSMLAYQRRYLCVAVYTRAQELLDQCPGQPKSSSTWAVGTDSFDGSGGQRPELEPAGEADLHSHIQNTTTHQTSPPARCAPWQIYSDLFSGS